MTNTEAVDVPKARTYFMASEGGSYFCYDHMEGVLATVITDGSRKGLFTRTDSTGAMLSRQFHREEMYGVPSYDRLYLPISEVEWHTRFNMALNDIVENFKIITL
jgi:hypothetical protein